MPKGITQEQEAQIASLAADSTLTNAQIAIKVGVSQETVRSRRASPAQNKTIVSSASDLTCAAIEQAFAVLATAPKRLRDFYAEQLSKLQ